MLVSEEKPWTLKAREVAQCVHCGGPRHPMGGLRCKRCYESPPAKQWGYSSYRFEFDSVPAKPPTVRRLELQVVTYVTPVYPKLIALKAGRLQVPEGVHVARAPFRNKIIRPKPIKIEAAPRSIPVSAYPFVRVAKDEHGTLMAVNSIVPQALPGREDVCQEILLALWEGKITLDQLRANRSNVGAFVRRFQSENYEASGYAISLDVPMRSGGSWHDVIADPNTMSR